jgi:BlaI family penicillinase repressor
MLKARKEATNKQSTPLRPADDSHEILLGKTKNCLEMDKPHLTRSGEGDLIPKVLGFSLFADDRGSLVEDLPTPTPRELDILKVLWEHGPLAVTGVHALIRPADGKQMAVNTVQTLLRIMETKGLVRHTTEGRTFIYEPVFSREESAARFLDRVFDGAASQLVLSLLRAEKISPQELDEMRELINQARNKDSSRRGNHGF